MPWYSKSKCAKDINNLMKANACKHLNTTSINGSKKRIFNIFSRSNNCPVRRNKCQTDISNGSQVNTAQFIIVSLIHTTDLYFSQKSMTTVSFWNDDVINTPTSNFWFWIALIDLDTKHNESKKWFNLHIAYNVWIVSNTFRAQFPQHFKMHGMSFAFHSKVSYAFVE